MQGEGRVPTLRFWVDLGSSGGFCGVSEVWRKEGLWGRGSTGMQIREMGFDLEESRMKYS